MNTKNRTIRIFNTKYKLKFVDKIEPEEDGKFTYGTCNSATQTIKIATKDIDGKPINNNIMEISFLHEIVHAILNEGQYSGSSDDEPLVEWLAKCLKHLKDQKVI